MLLNKEAEGTISHSPINIQNTRVNMTQH